VLTVLISVDWLNYPGFEAWKFVNLGLFIIAGIYLHHRYGKPLSKIFKSRASKIKEELESARQRRETAAAELKEVEVQLAQVESEVAKIRSEAEAEAAAERGRIRASTEIEIAKLKAQGEREIEKARKNAQSDVRKFAAGQGVALAETLIRQELNPVDDGLLIGISANQFGGSQR
jgi:F-type H+-transporting ATPase subunit b